jgi:hypothetical protein
LATAFDSYCFAMYDGIPVADEEMLHAEQGHVAGAHPLIGTDRQ